MRTIICKKCGAPIDASQGECPVCGAVYYVLPREDEDGDETRVWDDTAEKIHTAIEKDEMDMDKLVEEPTRAIPVQPAGQPKPAVQPSRQNRPTQSAAPAAGRSAAGPTRHPVQRNGKKPPSRTWIFAVVAAALLAVLTVVLCFMNGVFDFNTNAAVMPGVTGLTRDEAVRQLRELNISPNIIYEESTSAADTVIRQQPEAGKPVGKGVSVTLTVATAATETPSSEAEYVEVPEVMDMSYDAAAACLQSYGLTAVRGSEEFSETFKEGTVTRQSPLSGARVEKGSVVTLTVSKGPEERSFNIVLTAGKGGSVSPSGTVSVDEGESLKLTVIPDAGYAVAELRIDGQSVGAVTEYTLQNIDADHSVYAVFAPSAEMTSPTPEQSPEVTATPAWPGTPTDIFPGQ